MGGGIGIGIGGHHDYHHHDLFHHDEHHHDMFHHDHHIL
jgi:hypothetical protein